MAPFTCKVVDSFCRGLGGVHVVLQCKDERQQIVKTFESKTDSDGDIWSWFRWHPDGNTTTFESQRVDIKYTPFVSVTFWLDSLPSNIAAPWVNIHSDLFLAAEYCHGLVVHLSQHSPSYRLEHTRRPAISPAYDEMDWEHPATPFEATDFRIMFSRSPSPLRLPSPIVKPRGIHTLLPTPTTPSIDTDDPANDDL
jgi:hypothetical protein